MLKLQARDFFRGESQLVVVEPRTPQPLFPLHEHDFHEIVIVASGSGWHVLNDEPHLLSCGEVFHLQTQDRHAFDEVHDLYLTNVLYRPSSRWLHPDRLRPYLPPAGDQAGERRYWQISEDVVARLKPLLAALARECREPDGASDLMAESLFAQLLVTLWRDRFATDGEHLSPSGRIAHVLRYLRHNCTQAIDLDEIAHRFGYSPRNLRRVFREATATTPHGYLVKLRVGHAMRALRATDDSVTDIALASGFNDSNHFSHAFHKLIGMTPKGYRQRVRRPGRRDASS
ncbi:MAG TPA: helix-turn-helix domain-containing protein [Kofleriaceae bacterium]|nr:helix-turn-helix domain-containing protein [Kofleriaceae bacterium]